MLAVGGRADDGIALLDASPKSIGPVYLGPRHKDGRYDKRFEVIDNVFAPATNALKR